MATIYDIAFANIPGVGPATAKEIMNYFSSTLSSLLPSKITNNRRAAWFGLLGSFHSLGSELTPYIIQIYREKSIRAAW